MKKLIFAIIATAATAMVATAEIAFVSVRGKAGGIGGEIRAFDVQSTNATQTATLKRIRSAEKTTVIINK